MTKPLEIICPACEADLLVRDTPYGPGASVVQPLGKEFEKVLFDNLSDLYIEEPQDKKHSPDTVAEFADVSAIRKLLREDPDFSFNVSAPLETEIQRWNDWKIRKERGLANQYKGQAHAWEAVFNTLTKVAPGWVHCAPAGMAAAVKTITDMAAKIKPEWSLEDVFRIGCETRVMVELRGKVFPEEASRQELLNFVEILLGYRPVSRKGEME